MSTIQAPKPKSNPPAKEDPFRLGWRFVKETTPEGDVIDRQVPLTEEDVLHPQEEDFIVNTARHDRIVSYLKLAMQSPYVERQGIVVIGDMRIEWGTKHGWAHGPDVAVFGNVQGTWSESQGTFYPAKMQAKALLVVEATSPATHANDFGYKLREYYEVGVAVYVIVDIPYDGDFGSIQLFGYQAGRTQYQGLPMDDKGRLWLDAVGLWLGVEGLEVYLEDPQGNRLPDYSELVRRFQQVVHQATEEARLRKQAQAQAHAAEDKAAAESQARLAAEDKAAAESQARLAAEAKLRELEARLAGQHKNGK